MKRLITSLVLSTVALSHTMAAAAQPVPALERSASPASESESLAGLSGVWAALLAVALGIGIIILIEENEDNDLPTSP